MAKCDLCGESAEIINKEEVLCRPCLDTQLMGAVLDRAEKTGMTVDQVWHEAKVHLLQHGRFLN